MGIGSQLDKTEGLKKPDNHERDLVVGKLENELEGFTKAEKDKVWQ